MLEAPLLCRLLWGTFLAETRKVQLIDKLKFEDQFTKGMVKVKVVLPSRLVTEIFSPWEETRVRTI